MTTDNRVEPVAEDDRVTDPWPDLAPLMAPRSIAVVGASQREVRANRVIRTLLSVGFAGEIYPINPNYSEVLGLACFPNLASTPRPADCAVVAIPAAHIPGLLDTATAAGVRSAIVLASGFGEAGEQGQALERQLRHIAHRDGLLICGPNCFGILNVGARSAPFIGAMAEPLIPGNIALVSQSGGITNLVVPPLMSTRGIGFSYVVSCGNQAGVSIEDFINYCIEDPTTDVIGAYVEGFRRPRDLVALARKAADRRKPIVVLKVGRSDVARRSALAHTGSLVGAPDVTSAVLRRHGLVQTSSLNEFVETIALLSSTDVRERASAGVSVGVLTGTGGLMGYVGDSAADIGMELPALHDDTNRRLAAVLPEFAAPTNPLDGTGAMYDDPTLFPRLIMPLLDDPSIDSVAVNIDFNAVREGAFDAQRNHFVPSVVALAPGLSKPLVVFTAKAGGAFDRGVADTLRSAGVPLLDGADFALMALRNMAAYARHLARREPPAASIEPPLELPTLAGGALDSVTAFELLASAGIPTAAFALTTTADDAVAAADRIGYPVVLKVESASIQHKTEVGGVALDLRSPDAVREAFGRMVRDVPGRPGGAPVERMIVQRMAPPGLELLLGIKADPDFGPVVVCALGGVFVEVFDDVVIGVPPIAREQAIDMLHRLRSWPLMAGARAMPPADVDALCDAIGGLGDLALALDGRIEALDINPLILYPAGRGLLAVDALVLLR